MPFWPSQIFEEYSGVHYIIASNTYHFLSLNRKRTPFSSYRIMKEMNRVPVK